MNISHLNTLRRVKPDTIVLELEDGRTEELVVPREGRRWSAVARSLAAYDGVSRMSLRDDSGRVLETVTVNVLQAAPEPEPYELQLADRMVTAYRDGSRDAHTSLERTLAMFETLVSGYSTLASALIARADAEAATSARLRDELDVLVEDRLSGDSNLASTIQQVLPLAMSTLKKH